MREPVNINMDQAVRIRSYVPGDLDKTRTLWSTVPPYRPGDEAETQAIYNRALAAREASDRWISLKDVSDPVRSAGWVVVSASPSGMDRVVGFVEVAGESAFRQMPQNMPLANEWRQRDDLAQLTRLSVHPAVWRSGVGTRLVETAIEWCREEGFRTVALNTTSPQKPALQLYRKLGFREVGRSFLDRYELVWLELPL